MSDIQPHSDPAPLAPQPLPVAPGPACCAYCGVPLNAEFYFCTTCATPYINEETLLPRVRPQYLTEGTVVQRRAPQAMTLFWSYFAVVVGSAVIAYELFGEHRPDLQLVFETCAIFVTTCVFVCLYWRSLLPQLKRTGVQPAALAALAMLVPLLAVNYFYHDWLIKEMGAKDSMELARLRDAGLTQAVLVLLFCVFPAVTEEIAFRGLLQHWLQVALRPWRAILIASALFTALHFSVVSAPYLFCVGVLLGWTKWKTNSLYPSMLLHFLHNLAVIEFFHH